jgi:Skp family chaperone for outer membrane proteins
MDRSENYLLTRADGFVETPDGDIAVTMIAKGVPVPGTDPQVLQARFAPTPAAQSVLVKWESEAAISIFPAAISGQLMRLRMAQHPTAIAVSEFNAAFAQIAKDLEESIAKAKAEEEAEAERQVKEAADRAKADEEAAAKAKAEEEDRARKEAEEAAAQAKAEEEAKRQAEAKDAAAQTQTDTAADASKAAKKAAGTKPDGAAG